MRWFLIILIYALCLSDYHICEYFYKYDNFKWWELRTNLYSLEFLLFSIISIVGFKNKYQKIIIKSLMIFFIGDLIDRVVSGINNFQINDCFLIATNIIITSILLKKEYDNRPRIS